MENPSDETQSVRDDTEDPSRKDDDINAALRAIKLVDDDEPSCPIKIHVDLHSEVWYKSDIKLGLPESYAYVCYNILRSSATVKNTAMRDLFVHILQKSLPSELKGATDTEGVNYELKHAFRGITLEASGVNKKLPLLLEAITKCITQSANFVTEDLFRVSKEELLKHWCMWFSEPYQLSEMLVYYTMTQTCSTPIHRFWAISTVEFHDFQKYLNNFSRLVYIRSFVQGNLTESDAIQSVQKCVRILNSKMPRPNAVPLRGTMIPRGVRCCRVRSLDPDDWRSCTSNYYQFENPSLKLALMIEVFGRTITSDIWKPDHPKTIIGVKQLDRSKIENLCFLPTGYVITAKADDDDFNVALVDSWIEGFRKSLNAIFRDMTVDGLRGIKEYAIEEFVKLLVVAGSKEEACENWNEIIADQYFFGRRTRELGILREMSLEEFREWLVNLSMEESDRRLRKLTSQVVGMNEAWWKIPEWNRAQTGVENDRNTLTYSLKYLTHLSHEGRRKSRNYYITDIERYKNSLATFPYNPPSM